MSTLFECSLLSQASDEGNNKLLEFTQSIKSILPILANNSGSNCIGNIHIDRNGVSFIYKNTLESIKIDVFISHLIFNTFKYEQSAVDMTNAQNFTSIYINYNTLIYSLQNIVAHNNNQDLDIEHSNESEILIHYSKHQVEQSNDFLSQQQKPLFYLENSVDEESNDDDNINESIDGFNLILQDDFIKELISLKTFAPPLNNNIMSNTNDSKMRFDCILQSKVLLSTLNNLKPFQQHLKDIVLWFKHINLKPKFKHRDFFTNGVASNNIKLPNLILFNRNDEIGNIKISILNDLNKRKLKKQKKNHNSDDFTIENSDNIELLKFNSLDDDLQNKEEEAILLVDFKKIMKIIPVLKISEKILLQCDIDGTLFIQALVGSGYLTSSEQDRISIEITIPTKDIEVEENISVENLKKIITDYETLNKNQKPKTHTSKAALSPGDNSSITDNIDEINSRESLKPVSLNHFTQTQDKKEKKQPKMFF